MTVKSYWLVRDYFNEATSKGVTVESLVAILLRTLQEPYTAKQLLSTVSQSIAESILTGNEDALSQESFYNPTLVYDGGFTPSGDKLEAKAGFVRFQHDAGDGIEKTFVIEDGVVVEEYDPVLTLHLSYIVKPLNKHLEDFEVEFIHAFIDSNLAEYRVCFSSEVKDGHTVAYSNECSLGSDWTLNYTDNVKIDEIMYSYNYDIK